jgi:DNA/RNA endonuclease YhcR with UshA esterase domain
MEMPPIFVADIRQNASNVCMTKLVLIFGFLLCVTRASADGTNAAAPIKIGTADATNHYDQEMIVTGKVAQITIRPTVTFLNLDQPYPDSPFTVVIFHGHSSFYGDANALKGKSIEIKGKIKNYHDKPEIALDSTNQLAVFDAMGVNITSAILQSTNHARAMPQSPKLVPTPPVAQTNSIPEIM